MTGSQMLKQGELVSLRPYHLTWHADCGLQGYADPAGS